MLLPTTEWDPVRGYYKSMEPFRQFEDPAASTRGWWDLMQAKRYAGVRSAPDLDAAINAVASSGYATDPKLASKLRGIQAKTPEQENFLRQRQAEALEAGAPPHLAELAARQSALESAWGRSAPGNNYYGIKVPKGSTMMQAVPAEELPPITIPQAQIPQQMGPVPLMPGAPGFPGGMAGMNTMPGGQGPVGPDAAAAEPSYVDRMMASPLFQIGLGILSAPGYGGAWGRGVGVGIQQGMQSLQQRQKFEQEMADLQQKRMMRKRIQETAQSLPEPFRSIVMADPSSYGNVMQQMIAMQQKMNPQGKDRLMEVGGRLYDTVTQQWVQPGGATAGVPGQREALTNMPYYEPIAKEYDLGAYDPESVREAAMTGDASKLKPTLKPEQQLTQAERFGRRMDFYRGAAQAGQQINQLIDQPGAFSDVAAVYSLVKFLDPTSVVREGEVALMGTAMPLFDKIQNLFGRIEKGGLLGPEGSAIRNDVKKTMARLMEVYKENEGKLRGSIGKQAQRFSVDPEVWAGEGITWPEYQMPGPAEAPGAPISEAAAAKEKTIEELLGGL